MVFHFEDVNLVRGIFLVQEMSNILAAGQNDGSPHYDGFLQRFRGRWDNPHLVGATKEHQRRGHLKHILEN